MSGRPPPPGGEEGRDPKAGRNPTARRDAAAQSDPHGAEIARLETLAHLLDDVFRVPGTRLRFGLDGVVGLIPGIGDAATGVLAGYLALRARALGLPAGVIARMGTNVALDLAAGSVPVAGDLFDLAFKANRRNIELLKRELAKRAPADAPAEMKDVTPPSSGAGSDRRGGRTD
jgi:hypothetical protein